MFSKYYCELNDSCLHFLVKIAEKKYTISGEICILVYIIHYSNVFLILKQPSFRS